MCQANNDRLVARLDCQVGVARSNHNAVGDERHSIFSNQAFAMRNRPELTREDRHERGRQMLRDENGDTYALRERVEEHTQRMDSAG
jgi:hypothetical protein